MAKDSDVQVQRGHVRVNYPTLVVSVIAIISGVWLAATSYFTIINRLDRMAGAAVTHTQFRDWIDSLRTQNKALNVPSLPAKDDRISMSADVMFTETMQKRVSR